MLTPLRGKQGVRLLGPPDLDRVRALLAADPVTHVFMADRVESTKLDTRWLGGRVYGYVVDGELLALCHHAANLVPVGSQPAALRAFAERALADGRACSSIFGPEDAVLGLWDLLRERWGPARSLRPGQPVLSMSSESAVTPDPRVRVVRLDELDVVYPASVAMFTEEMGVSPEAGGAPGAYRARVAQLITQGRLLARIENGRVLFKAEIGAVTPAACQVQSVYVDRVCRGRGLATQGMATVVATTLRAWAPIVTLYVNADNAAARRVYDTVGFERTGTFATVLL